MSENPTIDKIADTLDNVEDLRRFSAAQFNTIQKLVKRVSQLEKENNELRASKSSQDNQSILTINQPQGVSDEETICILELNKLKNLSLVKELTLEECRKVETYVRSLNSIRARKDAVQNPAKEKSTEELLNEFSRIDSSWSIAEK